MKNSPSILINSGNNNSFVGSINSKTTGMYNTSMGYVTSASGSLDLSIEECKKIIGYTETDIKSNNDKSDLLRISLKYYKDMLAEKISSEREEKLNKILNND